MKNRGLTLIELISTLVVLSVIATIVFPNVYDALKDYKKGLYDIQIQSIIGATKDWAANNYDKLSSENGGETYVYLKRDLQDGGYIDEPLKNNKDGKEFNDNTFIVITCVAIESDLNNEENFNYTYEVYDTNEEHLTLLAQKYIKKNNPENEVTLTLSQLLTYAQAELKVSNSLKNIEDGTLINSASVVVDYADGNYTYEVK